MRVSFLNPGSSAGAFFGKMVAFMRVVAGQLGIDLEVLDCHRNRSRMIAGGKALVRRSPRPDYLLLVNKQNIALEILPQACAAGIRVMLVNEGGMAFDAEALGRPRERFDLWLGEVVPDDERAGRLLAESLIAAARAGARPAGDGLLHVAGLAGGYTSVSILRVGGLRQAVMEAENLSFHGVAPADWQQARAAELTAELLARYPETAVVWAASDVMARGAIEAVAASGRLPGRDVFVGGIGWAPLVPGMIRRGELSASVGGHFMDGAWALIMLWDLHQGRDFETLQTTSSGVLLTRDNLDDYTGFFDEKQWREADLTRLSRVRNPTLESYDFAVDSVRRLL